MSSFLYKVREFLQNLIPVAIIAGLAFGGYSLYKQGTFRNGLKPAMHTIVKKIPYFGTRFGHYSAGSSSSRSYGVAKRYSSFKKHGRGGRKHKVSHRSHRKHRRHHR